MLLYRGAARYSFSQLGYNTMLLLPPPDDPCGQPLYHITVQMNYLRPLSYATVVRRGGSERGSYVGEFEWQCVLFMLLPIVRVSCR